MMNLLVEIAGFSAEVMKQSPPHERKEAANRGLQLALSGLFHFASMWVSLTIFGVPLLAGGAFSALTASILFCADRSLIIGLREGRGARTLLEQPLDLTSILGPVARLLASIVIGALMGSALALVLFDRDTEDHVADMQRILDAPVIAELEAEYDDLLAQAQAGVSASEATLAAAVLEAQTRGQAVEQGMAAANAQRTALLVRRSELWSLLTAGQTEMGHWTDVAACERGGIADGAVCAGSSGNEGEGRRWEFAASKASRIEESLASLRAELAEVETQIAALPAPNADFSLIDVERQAQLRQAHDAKLAEYRSLAAARPEALAGMLSARPDREIIDPKSIYARIDALGQLMASSVSFFWVALAAKCASIVLELLPLLSELGRRASVYDLNVVAEVHKAHRNHRKRILQDEAEDLPLFADLDRRRREIEREAFVASFMNRNRRQPSDQ
jgi:hypothetical protein